MANTNRVRVPDIGGFKDVSVIDVLVKDGQRSKKKRRWSPSRLKRRRWTCPSPAAGKIAQVKLKAGDKVSEGSVIMLLETRRESARRAEPRVAAGATAAPQAGRTPAPEPPAPRRRGAKPPSPRRRRRPEPAPAARPPADAAAAPRRARRTPRRGETEAAAERRRRARCRAARAAPIDEKAFSRHMPVPRCASSRANSARISARSQGTRTQGAHHARGRQGVRQEAAHRRAGAAPPARRCRRCRTSISRFRRGGNRSRCRASSRISGARLQASWINLPHVTQHEDADITELGDRARRAEDQGGAGGRAPHAAGLHRQGLHRGAQGVSALQCLAGCERRESGLQEVLQHRLRGRHAEWSGGARDSGRRSPQYFRDRPRLAEMSEKARAGKLKAAEMQGGTFTISSLGRHRRHGLHAHHQCAGSRDPGRVQSEPKAGVRARAHSSRG